MSETNDRARWLTLAEGAEHVGLHVKTLRRRIASGDLPAYRMPKGRALRVKREDLDALFRAIPTA